MGFRYLILYFSFLFPFTILNLSASPFKEDYSQFVQIFKTHYGLTAFKKEKVGVDLTQLFEEQRSYALESSSPDEFWQRLQSIVAPIRDTHVVLYRGSSGYSCLPIRTYFIQGKVYVIDVAHEVKNAALSSLLMSELISIDGIPVKEFLEALSLRHRHSTPHDDLHTHAQNLSCRKNHVFGKKIGSSEIVYRPPSGTEIQSIRLDWKQRTNQNIASDKPYVIGDSIHFPAEFHQTHPSPVGGFWSKREKTYGYIQVPSFMRYPVKTWPPSKEEVREFLKPFQTALKEADNWDRLIVDLRDNRGGVAYYYCPFLKMVGESDEVEECKEINTQDYPQLYHGSVVALTNAGCRSGCEIVSYILKKSNRSLLVGHQTAGGGAYGTIPDGAILKNTEIQVQLSIGIVRVEGETFENEGIAPEIPFEFQVSDFQNGQWPMIQKLTGL